VELTTVRLIDLDANRLSSAFYVSIIAIRCRLIYLRSTVILYSALVSPGVIKQCSAYPAAPSARATVKSAPAG